MPDNDRLTLTTTINRHDINKIIARLWISTQWIIGGLVAKGGPETFNILCYALVYISHLLYML